MTTPPATRTTNRRADATDIDWQRLARHLAGHGLQLDHATPPKRFAGGLANRNFLIHLSGEPAVFRCPPPGELPPGAYDMAREHLILSHLSAAFPLAPWALHFCADTAVIGVPFQINEYRAGLVLHGDALGDAATVPGVGGMLSRLLIDTLVDLHSVDPEAIGLDTLGKPVGFVARNVAGWIKRANAVAAGRPSAAVREIGAWLSAGAVPDVPVPRLLHSDFKLDNIILNPDTLAPTAVLDWDMGTRGHPLMDLATLMSYWAEPEDPTCLHALEQMPTARDGFFSRDEAIERYAVRSGADVSDYPFFRVLAMFKLGVVFQQLHQLYRDGKTTDERYARFGALGQDLLSLTFDITQGRAL